MSGNQDYILLESIEFVQSRVKKLDEDVVTEYASLMKRGVDFPPAFAVFDGIIYWVWDGVHRGEARKMNGKNGLLVEWTSGEEKDAHWLALSANRNHGLRRTNADKQAVVKKALEMYWEKTNAEIAKHCGVDQTTVAGWRTKLRPNESDEEKIRTTSNGRKMKVGGIGKKSKKVLNKKEQTSTELLISLVNRQKKELTDLGDQPNFWNSMEESITDRLKISCKFVIESLLNNYETFLEKIILLKEKQETVDVVD